MTVVIVGGGLTGLVAAERLEAAGREVVVCEREATPGGACRTETAGAYTFDYTGHLLHVAHERTREYLGDLGVWSRLAEHERRAAICLAGAVTPYPIQIHTHALPPEVRRDCLLGFVRAWAAADAPEPENFSQWVLERFGAGLARHFFFPYNEKLYRTPAGELTLDWVGRYVPKPDLEAVIDGALGLHDADVGYNARFRYPAEGGIRLLADAVAARVEGLRLGCAVKAIDLDGRWVEIAGGERLPWDRLVVTAALPFALDLVVSEIPDAVAEARRQLRWVKVANLAYGVRGAAPRPEHWLYFPEPEYPFYRVGFPSNHGRLAPPDCHTVSVEISLDPGRDLDAAVVDRSEESLVRLGLLDPANVEERAITAIDPAYVVFDHRRRRAVTAIQRFFSQRDVILAGRWAQWKYSAMEDAVLDGMAVARRLRGA